MKSNKLTSQELYGVYIMNELAEEHDAIGDIEPIHVSPNEITVAMIKKLMKFDKLCILGLTVDNGSHGDTNE